jgi:hypothetical protein
MKFAYNVYPVEVGQVNWSVTYHVVFYVMIITLLSFKRVRSGKNGRRWLGIGILYFLLLIGMNLLCIGNKERYELWFLADRSMFTIISVPSIFVVFAMGFVNINFKRRKKWDKNLET